MSARLELCCRNGTEIDRDVISEYQFQKDAAADVRQKDAAWRVSYTPPHNEVRVTRDTNDGATVISSFNFSAATALADADIVYPGIDTEGAEGVLRDARPSQVYTVRTERVRLTYCRAHAALHYCLGRQSNRVLR